MPAVTIFPSGCVVTANASAVVPKSLSTVPPDPNDESSTPLGM